MKLRWLAVFSFALWCCLGWARSGPHAGTFTVVDTTGSEPEQYTITLTPFKDGEFTVRGFYSKGRGGNEKITGMLHKSGRLNATVHLQGDSFVLDGNWSTNDNTLVLRLGSHNMVTKEERKDSADDWIVDEPKIEDKGCAHGSAGTITGSVTIDGKTGGGTITISGMPRRVKNGEHIIITLGAAASAPANVSAWVNLGDIGTVVTKQDGVYTNGNGKLKGTCEIIFHGESDSYIQISGGFGDYGWSLVTFKFHKAKQ